MNSGLASSPFARRARMHKTLSPPEAATVIELEERRGEVLSPVEAATSLRMVPARRRECYKYLRGFGGPAPHRTVQPARINLTESVTNAASPWFPAIKTADK